MLLLLAVVLMSPPVQTAMARKFLSSLEEKLDGKISFESLSVRPFDAVVIENAALIDSHPYFSPKHPKMIPADTVACAEYIGIVFNPWGLLGGGSALVSDLTIRNGRFCLVNEPGTSNIKRIFGKNRKPADPNKPKATLPDRPLLRCSRLDIEGFRFRLMNFRNPKPDRDRAMNWTNLDARDISLKAHDITITGIITEGTVDHLSARERSGYVINHMSGKARVYNMETKIENLVIRDLWSDLHFDYYKMSPDKGEKSLGPFTNEVMLEARIAPSRLNIESIAYFAPTLHKMNIVTNIEEAFVHGYVNDLSVKGFKFRTPDGEVEGEVDGTITGAEHGNAMMTNYDIKRLSFTSAGISRFIHGWAPGMKLDFGQFGKGERFSFTGSLRGLLDNAAISGTLKPSSGGSLSTKLDFRNLISGGGQPIHLNGSLRTADLHLGRLAGSSALGPATMRANFRAEIGQDVSLRLDSLRIDRLHALNYDYRGLLAAGTYKGDAFNGTIFCNDPNLNFMASGMFSLSNKSGGGAYKFSASVLRANLRALHIDSRETSLLSFESKADFKTLRGGDILGSIKISDIKLTDAQGKRDLGSIFIDSYNKDNVNRINISSQFANLSYSGSAFCNTFVSDIAALSAGRELPALYPGTPARWSGNTYDVTLKTFDSQDLLSFVAPGLYLASGTTLNVSVNGEGIISGRLKSQRLALGNKYIKEADLTFGNADGFLGGELDSEEIKIQPIRTLGNRILLYAKDNSLGLGFSFDNETEPAGRGELFIRGTLSRDANKELLFSAGILPSSVSISGETWRIGSSPIEIRSGRVKTGSLLIENEQQRIGISGGWAKADTDTLRITMENFDLSATNDFVPKGLNIKGIANGAVIIPSPASEGLPPLLADLTVSDAYIADSPLGQLKVLSRWDGELKGYRALCRNDLGGVRNIDFSGSYVPSGKKVSGNARFDGLDISYAAPLLTSVFSEMEGRLSGEVLLGGTIDNLTLSSKELAIQDGVLRIDYTNVPYKVDGRVNLTTYGAFFDEVSVSDRNGAKGNLNGGIRWNHLKDFYMDLGMTFEKMEAVNLEEGTPGPFYGHIKAGGNVKLTGPFSALQLDVDATTYGDGQLFVPLNSSGGSGRKDLLTFKEAVSVDHVDPYEILVSSLQRKEKKESRFGTRLNISAHPGIEAVIEIDKDEGNIISGRGNGNIELNINPIDGAFTMSGSYGITDGTYHFVALGIAKRDFTIQTGSKVQFNGDIMETELDINAVYKTKTSLATLLADTTAITSRRIVECGINMTGRLKNPRMTFSINVPDIDPTTRGRVESAINTEDKLQKQFLSLLISGGFLPDEQSSIVNNSSMLGSTVSEMMASQLSNILQKLNIPIDLGLDYQQNSGGADIFDVAVSTQLFNNRLIVNGSIGNRQYGTTSSQEVVGDIDIEIKIDRAGTLRGSVFLHSADQYTNYLDNLQRSGIGIAYQREFDTFRELFRSLFPFAFKKASQKLPAVADEPKIVVMIEEDD